MRHFLVVLFWAVNAFGAACVAAPEPAPGSVLRDCRDCPEMVVVPAGSFTMGSNADEQARFGVTPAYAATEVPAHPVRIARPFAIGRMAVTRGEYAQFAGTTVGDGGCAVFSDDGKWGQDDTRSWRDPHFAQDDREPVVCVNLAEARRYAAWLSERTGQRYRLPSEAEWEYAARAGTTTANYWGDGRDGACAAANAWDLTAVERRGATATSDSTFGCRDGYVYTAPVDAFPPNAFGLYGMSGNVWQIVDDCFHATYDGATADGSVWAGGDCHYHMDRGASWGNTPRYVRAGARHKDLMDARTSVLGFRVVREITP